MFFYRALRYSMVVIFAGRNFSDGFQPFINPARGFKMYMKQKTILLWGLDDLLSSSVELFLTTQKGWNVINISDEENLDAMIATVNKINPDVVILHKGKQTGSLNLPTTLLQDHPNLKVITVSLSNNLMEVYSKQNILVESAADLISAVEMERW